MASFSTRRLLALCRKEGFQIVRDPSSILIAFILPVLLLFVLGYAVNLDADHLRIGLVVQDQGVPAQRLVNSLYASRAFEVHQSDSQAQLLDEMAHGKVRGIVIIPSDFSAKAQRPEGGASVQLLADGSEPNTAQFVNAYLQGVWEIWQNSLNRDRLKSVNTPLKVVQRSWYNPSNVSRNFLVPGSIAVVMTIIGAMLTSLVVAREWERGTMEALLATPVTGLELLLSKILPYYLLGMAAMCLCWLVAVLIMHVPFRGSFVALFILSSLFLGSALGLGLFLSTVLKTQFFAAQAALTAAFLPSMMLSGFVYEIKNMPEFLQWLTVIIPARYFASSLQTLFQVGDVLSILLPNAFFLSLLSIFWLGLSAIKTRRTLD